MDDILYLAGAVTGLAAAGTIVMAFIGWTRKIAAGTRCQLRSDMLRTYYRHREEGEIRQYEYENFVMAYEAYHALGGNSFMEKIYGEVKEWEVVT